MNLLSCGCFFVVIDVSWFFFKFHGWFLSLENIKLKGLCYEILVNHKP